VSSNDLITLLVLILGYIGYSRAKKYFRERNRKKRRDWYRNVYLKSDDWRRKRYVVLKRDNWTCVSCGAKATQVHHTQYLGKNLGKEPIEWLESLCHSCHQEEHE
jgi:5-methylcytosine-specific restriction endonuclease McrA